MLTIKVVAENDSTITTVVEDAYRIAIILNVYVKFSINGTDHSIGPKSNILEVLKRIRSK